MQFIRKRRWRLLNLGVILVLIVTSRSFINVYFVQPIALFLWAAWRVLASVHQNVYWTLLLVGGFLPLVWMIFSAKGVTARSAYRQDPLPPGRVEYWEQLLAGVHGNQKDQERVRKEWGMLIQSVMAQAGWSNRDDFSGDDIESLAEVSRWITRPASGPGRVPWVQKFKQRLPQSFQQCLTSMMNTDDPWIRDSLRWMESELDIPYDE
jgi:hypothetical protein